MRLPSKKAINAKQIADMGLGPDRGTVYHELRIGEVTRVDNERMTIDVQWVTSPGAASLGVYPDMMVTSMGWGHRSFMGTLPEKGSLVVCGYIRIGPDQWMPFPLAYFPKGFENARDFLPLQEYYGDEMDVGDERVRARMRKIYPGEALIQSVQGSEVLVDADILLSNQRANEIILRAADQSILQRALNHLVFGDGVAIRSGMIVRNDLTAVDLLAEGEGQVHAPIPRPAIILPDGRRHLVVTSDGRSTNVGGVPYAEWRVDVQEFGTGSIPVVRDIDGAAVDSAARDPLATMSLGTLVGGDPDEPSLYGQALAPDIADGNFVLEAVGLDRTEDTAAFYLKAGGYQMAITKEGGKIEHAPAVVKSSYPKGWEINLGINDAGEGFRIDTDGAVVFNSGKEADGNGRQGWGFVVNAGGAMKVRVEGTTEGGRALDEKFEGSALRWVTGENVSIVDGESVVFSKSNFKHNVYGNSVEIVAEDKTENIGGLHTTTIMKEQKTTINEGKRTAIMTPLGGLGPSLPGLQATEWGDFWFFDETVDKVKAADKTAIMDGSSLLEINMGSIRMLTNIGDIGAMTLMGDVRIGAGMGDVKVGVMEGAVTVKNYLGDEGIKLSTYVGAIQMTSMQGMELRSPESIKLMTNYCEIGGIMQGGVVTGLPGVPSHFDYMTGLPLKGSPTVMAGQGPNAKLAAVVPKMVQEIASVSAKGLASMASMPIPDMT